MSLRCTKGVSPGDRVPVSCLGESAALCYIDPELSWTRRHSTYPSSLWARNPFLCPLCCYPELTPHLASSLFPGFPSPQCILLQGCSVRVLPGFPALSLCHGSPQSRGTRWGERGRAVGFVWMCKQSGTGLPREKNSFAYIC